MTVSGSCGAAWSGKAWSGKAWSGKAWSGAFPGGDADGLDDDGGLVDGVLGGAGALGVWAGELTSNAADRITNTNFLKMNSVGSPDSN
jgi:hypothetical protein